MGVEGIRHDVRPTASEAAQLFWNSKLAAIAMEFETSYFLNKLLRPNPAIPARPTPRSNMVAGSGTGS